MGKPRTQGGPSIPEQAGRHAYFGSCAPGEGGWSGQQSFSLGVFEWLPKSRGGVKKSKIKVRVSGQVSDPEPVYERAKAICDDLDAGRYNGPKHVVVK